MKLLWGVKYVISTCLNAQFQMPASAMEHGAVNVLATCGSCHVSGLCFSEEHEAEILFEMIENI